MTSRWGEETTLKFVQEYGARECLWNTKLPIHKNKQAREAAYKEMEVIMGLQGFGTPDIKNKIRTLRSTYAQELRRIKDSKKSGAGTDSIYVTHLKWFHEMHTFLYNVESNREAEDNISAQLDESNEYVEKDIQNYTENKSKPENVKDLPPPRRRTKIQKLSGMVHELKHISKSAMIQPVGNQFDIFGQSVAAQLSQLSQYNAILAQDKIQSILTSFKLKELHSQTTSSMSNQSTPSSVNDEHLCLAPSQYTDLPVTPSSVNKHSYLTQSLEYMNFPEASPISSTTYFPYRSNENTSEELSCTSTPPSTITSDILATAFASIQHRGP